MWTRLKIFNLEKIVSVRNCALINFVEMYWAAMKKSVNLGNNYTSAVGRIGLYCVVWTRYTGTVGWGRFVPGTVWTRYNGGGGVGLYSGLWTRCTREDRFIWGLWTRYTDLGSTVVHRDEARLVEHVVALIELEDRVVFLSTSAIITHTRRLERIAANTAILQNVEKIVAFNEALP